MISTLEDLWKRKDFFPYLQTYLSKKCTHSLRERIAFLHQEAESENIIVIALSLCTEELIDHRNEVEDLIRGFQIDRQENEDWNIIEEIANQGFSWMMTALCDNERAQIPAKKVYKSLCDCLSKAAKNNTVIVCKVGRNRAYGPPSLPINAPLAHKGTGDLSLLPEPAAVPVKDVMTREYLVPQALLLWERYMEQFMQGVPHFLPIFTLQEWLCKRYNLLPEEDLRNDYDRFEDDRQNTPDIMLEKQEFLEQARFCALSLPDRLADIYILLYDNARQDDAAHAMGYQSASGLDRHKKDLEQRVRDYITGYTYLIERSPNKEQLLREFGYVVYKECKKRRRASNK